jgi:hypothetical protein
VEQPFKQCYISDALEGTADILEDNSDPDCSDSNSNLGESVNLQCENECTSEEEGHRNTLPPSLESKRKPGKTSA